MNTIEIIDRILEAGVLPYPGPRTRSLVIVHQIKPVLVEAHPYHFTFLPFARGNVSLGVRMWINAEERAHIDSCDQFRMTVLEEK